MERSSIMVHRHPEETETRAQVDGRGSTGSSETSNSRMQETFQTNDNHPASFLINEDNNTMQQQQSTDDDFVKNTAETAASSEKKDLLRQRCEAILFGRTEEEAILNEFLASEKARHQSSQPSSTSSILLITGEPGVGKTRLACSVIASAVEDNTEASDGEGIVRNSTQVRFVKGSFQESSLIPYSGFVAACQDYVQQILLLQDSHKAVNKATEAIQEKLTTHQIHTLLNVIPEISQLISSSSSSNETRIAKEPEKHKKTYDPNEIEEHLSQRFGTIFGRFLSAICSPHRPLVLFLDNLQFATTPSMDLLSSIAAEQPVNGLTIVVAVTATTTDNEQDDNVSSKIDTMERHFNIEVTRLHLKPLSPTILNQTMNEILKTAALAEELLSVTVQITQGKFLRLVWFLAWLEHSKYIMSVDSVGDKWTWNKGTDYYSLEIDEEDIVKRFQHIILWELNHHFSRNPEFQTALRSMASLGLCFNLSLLENVTNIENSGHLEPLLNHAVDIGFLERCHPPTQQGGGELFEEKRFYRFQNKEIRDVLSLDSMETHRIHLEAAQEIWRTIDSENEFIHQMTFILHHFYLSTMNRQNQQRNPHQQQSSNIPLSRPSEKEKLAVSSLCLHVGRQAAEISSFSEAFTALEFAIYVLLGDNSNNHDNDRNHGRIWRDHYDLLLALYNHAVEIQISMGNFSKVLQLVQPVFRYADKSQPLDQIRAVCAKIYATGSMGRHHEALDLGRKAAKELLGYSKLPTKEISFLRLLYRMNRIKKLLKRKSDEQILRMPILKDERILFLLHVLNLMVIDASMLPDPKLPALLVLISMEITLSFGLSVFASLSFIFMGAVSVEMRDHDSAFRFGRIGLSLLAEFGKCEFLPRVYGPYYTVIHVWRNPIQECLAPILRSHQVGIQTGDIQFACLNGLMYCSYAIEAGQSLRDIEKIWYRYYDIAKSKNHEIWSLVTLLHLQRVHHYLGISDDPLADQGNLISYSQAFAQAQQEQQHIVMAGVKYSCMQLGYIFHDYDLASRWMMTQKEVDAMPRTFEYTCMMFLRASIFLERAKSNRRWQKFYLRRVSSIVKMFHQWIDGTPHGFLDRYYLLKAEIASIIGRTNQKKQATAYRYYVAAIAAAAHEDNLFMHAVANERLALHLLGLHEKAKAMEYFEIALVSFDRWGAAAKVKQLREYIGSL